MQENLLRGWSAWGEFHEGLFMQQQLQQSAAAATGDAARPGVTAMMCYLQALRTGVSASGAAPGQAVQPLSECKQRKLVARVLWLLVHEEDRAAIGECFRDNCLNVPYTVWIPWCASSSAFFPPPPPLIQLVHESYVHSLNVQCVLHDCTVLYNALYTCRLTQLINLCIGPEGPYLEKFLGRISFAHPHAIFLTLRTHYHCLRIEFTEKSTPYALRASPYARTMYK